MDKPDKGKPATEVETSSANLRLRVKPTLLTMWKEAAEANHETVSGMMKRVMIAEAKHILKAKQ